MILENDIVSVLLSFTVDDGVVVGLGDVGGDRYCAGCGHRFVCIF